METEEKVRENALRRKLARMGYHLVKNRRRDPRAWDFGGYMIADSWSRGIVAGAPDFSLSLEDVEAFAEEEKPNPPKKRSKKGGK